MSSKLKIIYSGSYEAEYKGNVFCATRISKNHWEILSNSEYRDTFSKLSECKADLLIWCEEIDEGNNV